MVERYVLVAEMIFVSRDFYLIAASVFIHPRQSSVNVRLPRINHVPHVLRLRYLPQVLDVVVEAVAVDMVYLHRRETPVVPCPNGAVHEESITFAKGIKIYIHITAYAISSCVLITLHHAIRCSVHELSAAVVIIIVLLDASRQCGQLAICQINSIHIISIKAPNI